MTNKYDKQVTTEIKIDSSKVEDFSIVSPYSGEFSGEKGREIQPPAPLPIEPLIRHLLSVLEKHTEAIERFSRAQEIANKGNN